MPERKLATASTTSKVLHIIGQAHLDPVWMWPWRDGCAEALTTMQSALDRMRETPGFCFTHSAAATYRWAQEMDVQLFDVSVLVSHIGLDWRSSIGPWEIRTFAIGEAGGRPEAREVDLLYP